MDFRPRRMVVVAKEVGAFIREFFDQNPLSQIGLVTTKDRVAHCLTDLGGRPKSHVKALMGKLECSGDSSLQNALDLMHGSLNRIPSYGHREVLILYSALSTCDPGDILETIQKCKKSKIRCSVIGLSAEMFVCKHFCQETGGSYSVALDEVHLKELILEHAPAPPAIAEFAVATLIKLGFPKRAAEGSVSICSCRKEAKVGVGYTCPRCKACVCELPTECRICGLQLVSSSHLARSSSLIDCWLIQETNQAFVLLAPNAKTISALTAKSTFMKVCTTAQAVRTLGTQNPLLLMKNDKYVYCLGFS